MKKVYLILSAIMLFGCEPHANERTDLTVLPEGLKDCKFYWVSNGTGGMNVARCPNSSTTTYTGGKTPHTTVTVDQ